MTKIELRDFTTADLEEAERIMRIAYRSQVSCTPALPEEPAFPSLLPFAENGMGVVAVLGGEVVAYLASSLPYDHAFGTAARGAFSPMHGNGGLPIADAGIWRRLYQAAAEKWVARGARYHAIVLYQSDTAAREALSLYGAGCRCADAVREAVEIPNQGRLTCRLLSRSEAPRIRALRRRLAAHMESSPCFMSMSPGAFDAWIVRKEAAPDVRIYAAMDGDEIVGYTDMSDSAENFATECADMANITGAYLLPEYRGRGEFDRLISFAIARERDAGAARIGVDYETMNPTAIGYWEKRFCRYTVSMTRRVDEF